MSEFVLLMRSSVSSAASAYIQFANDYVRKEYTTFIFVEDWPDVIAYQHILELEGASFLGCGGKDGVFKLFGKLSNEGRAVGQCFIVDRDIEDRAQGAEQEVLRTEGYSWKNHLVESSATLRIAQRRSQPNLSMQESEGVVCSWERSISAFERLLALHGALLRVKKPAGLDLDLHTFPVTHSSTLVEGILTPGLGAESWIESKLAEFLERGGSEADVQQISENLASQPIVKWARGKTIFSLWRRFITLKFGELGCRFLGEISATGVVLMLPQSNPSWKYIQDYVRDRVAA